MNISERKWPARADMVAVIVWLSVVGVAVAILATTATTPPLFDAISYATKAMNFWETLGQGKLVNPLNLAPSMRPPGTILLSYPFGYTPDFVWFFFRSAFVPVVLLAVAVYIAGDEPGLPPPSRWLLAAFAVALAGMPGLYQFHPNAALELRMNGTHPLAIWGHVDNYFAGVAALALAAAVRSVRRTSLGWAVAAAALGAFSLLIKPVGFTVMALVGVSWVLLIWCKGGLRTDAAVRAYVVKGFAIAVVIYAAVALACFHSDYFSPTNIAYGNRALAVFKAEFGTPLTAELLRLMARHELGVIVPVALVAGIWLAIRRHPGAAGASLLCIAAGAWLLLVQTGPGQFRYFLPFAAMGFIAVVPSLITVNARAARIGAVIAVVPSLIITALLILRDPPQRWQDAAGINLPKVDYAAERAQAEAFFRHLEETGVARTIVYQFDITPPLYQFAAALDYRNYMVRTAPQVQMIQPVDWEHPSAFRFEQIRQSDYIALEPVEEAATREAILAQRTVPDFRAETRLMNVWFSTLTEADGVSVVSNNTHVRLLKIVDHGRLEASLEKLQESYRWPPAFTAVNLPRWWSTADVETLRRDNPAAAVDLTFQADPALPTAHIYAAKVDPEALGVQARFWVRSQGPVDGWYLFAHITNEKGETLAGTHAALMTPQNPERPIRYYTLDFPRVPEGATQVAFGFYKPEKDTAAFLAADNGTRDWNNQRVLMPITKP